MMLYYVPLELIPERFSYQLSAPDNGWMERFWRQYNIPYTRINSSFGNTPTSIKEGQVLDARRRSTHCFEQMTELLGILDEMPKDEENVIYFDDFWHPGVEAIPYACQVLGIRKPIMAANLWAQSVDKFDFTYSMRNWIRDFEKGMGSVYDFVFTACPMLKGLVADKIVHRSKVFAVGHPWNTEEVHNRMRFDGAESHPRAKQVVYSSRWDTEKDPWFFLQVIDKVHEMDPEIDFVVCTSSPDLKSNDPALLDALDDAINRLPNLTVHEGLTKEIYYEHLLESRVQFNCAKQDWISYVLLEGSAAGCFPVYPKFRSFPETFLGQNQYMYRQGDVLHASERIVTACNNDNLFTTQAIQNRAWIHERFDDSIYRMMWQMGVLKNNNIEIGSEKLRDPFGIY